MNRSFSLLIFGLGVGVAIGLYLGWVAFPLELVDITPLDLEEEHQAIYLRLIAATYVAEEDLEEARSRIATLGRIDWQPWLMDQTINEILEDPASDDAYHLVRLAEGLGLANPNFDIVSERENSTDGEELGSPLESEAELDGGEANGTE